MLIKKIKGKDIDSLYKIGLEEFKGEFWFTKRFLKETIGNPGYHYGAFEKDKLIGGILVKRFDRPKLWIFFLAIDKNYRRKGIGTKLLKLIESKCSENYPLIFVDLCDKMVKAKNFYTKNGFKEQAKISNWFGVNKEGLIYSKLIFTQ